VKLTPEEEEEEEKNEFEEKKYERPFYPINRYFLSRWHLFLSLFYFTTEFNFTNALR
jgi:hypothetical protein